MSKTKQQGQEPKLVRRFQAEKLEPGYHFWALLEYHEIMAVQRIEQQESAALSTLTSVFSDQNEENRKVSIELVTIEAEGQWVGYVENYPFITFGPCQTEDDLEDLLNRDETTQILQNFAGLLSAYEEMGYRFVVNENGIEFHHPEFPGASFAVDYSGFDEAPSPDLIVDHLDLIFEQAKIAFDDANQFSQWLLESADPKFKTISKVQSGRNDPSGYDKYQYNDLGLDKNISIFFSQTTGRIHPKYFGSFSESHEFRSRIIISRARERFGITFSSDECAVQRMKSFVTGTEQEVANLFNREKPTTETRPWNYNDFMSDYDDTAVTFIAIVDEQKIVSDHIMDQNKVALYMGFLNQKTAPIEGKKSRSLGTAFTVYYTGPGAVNGREPLDVMYLRFAGTSNWLYCSVSDLMHLKATHDAATKNPKVIVRPKAKVPDFRISTGLNLASRPQGTPEERALAGLKLDIAQKDGKLGSGLPLKPPSPEKS